MPRFAQVALPLPIPKVFDYEVPLAWEVQPGCRVRVPFGRRKMTGVVTALSGTSSVSGVKPAEALLDKEPPVSPKMLEFTRWIADYYLAGWGEVLPLACPPLTREKVVSWVRVKDKALLLGMARALTTRQARSRAALLELAGKEGVVLADLKQEGLSPAVLKAAVEKGGLALEKRALEKNEDSSLLPAPPMTPGPVLTAAQTGAEREVGAALKTGKNQAFLLLGVTGSGKTEVYLRALQAALDLGGGAIVLVPEIALTPQTLQRFASRFPGKVALLHSGLKASERAAAFMALKSGRARVALGPRSALFTPVKNLKLIVVDEESEPSYKQENAPRYHARDAALVRAALEGAVALLGSATPSLEAYQNCLGGKLKLLSLPDRVTGEGLPEFHFLPLPEYGGPARSLGPDLAARLKEAFERGEQSLVFLNRRGYAPLLSCVACGQAVMCPNCAISLTYHLQRSDPLAKMPAPPAGGAGILRGGPAGWSATIAATPKGRPRPAPIPNVVKSY